MQDSTIQIPPWYKLTELWVIPTDWEVKKMGALAKIQRGASPRPIDDPIWFDKNSKIWWVRISDVTKSNKYLYNTTQKLSEKGVRRSRYIEKGNLIMSICATVGRPVITKLNVCIHDWFVIFGQLTEDKEYLYYYLQFIESEWWKNGQTGSQMNLNTNIIQTQYVSLPDFYEQQSIATALSDIDNLITSLDDLISKKQAVKQWTMQQLLTGKKRLPGFSGEWEEKEFDDLLLKLPTKPYQIQSSQYKLSWKYPVIDQWKQQVIAYSDEEYKAFKNKYSWVIVFWDHTRIFKYVTNDFIVWADWTQILQTKNTSDIKFLYYFLLEQDIPNTWYNRHFKYLKEIKFRIPNTFSEQQAITTVLSDMDAEIESLQAQQSKYKNIKQWMMQQLLTGKIRLIDK